MSAERVLDDLEKAKRDYDYDFVRFYDSNMFVDEERIKKICQGVIEKKLNFKWIKCNGDAFILARYSSDTLKLMNKAGVSNILLGVESGYEPALKCVQKAANVEDNLKAARRLHEHNISIGFSFMFGFPYDLSPEKLKQEHRKELIATMQTIVEFSDDYLPGDYYLLFLFTPYPGVRLFSTYEKLGYVPPNSLEGWGSVNLNENQPGSWISPFLLRIHSQCLKMNWFLMHKLKKNIFGGSNNILLKKCANFCDDTCCYILKKRIARGQLALPVVIKMVFYCFRIKAFIKMNGWRAFIKKALSKLGHWV